MIKITMQDLMRIKNTETYLRGMEEQNPLPPGHPLLVAEQKEKSQEQIRKARKIVEKSPVETKKNAEEKSKKLKDLKEKVEYVNKEMKKTESELMEIIKVLEETIKDSSDFYETQMKCKRTHRALQSIALGLRNYKINAYELK